MVSLKNTVPALAILLSLAVAPCFGSQTSVLGPDGAVYRIHEGDYGAFFPEGNEASPSDPVLALEVLGETHRSLLLVPGTEGPELEHAASLVSESDTHTLHVVWATDYKLVNSRIDLVAYRPGRAEPWSERIELSGDIFSLKGRPSLGVVRQEVRQQDERGFETTLHVVWWELNGLEPRISYAVVRLVDGTIAEISDVLALDKLIGAGVPVDDPLGASIGTRPEVALGSDRSSVIVSFLDAAADEFIVARVRVPHRSLIDLATAVADELERTLGPACDHDLAGLADRAVANAVDRSDVFLDASFQKLLADELESWLIEHREPCAEGGETRGIVSDGNDARSHIILSGLRATSPDQITPFNKARSHIILSGLRRDGRSGGVTVGLEMLRRFPALDVPVSAQPRLHISSSGRHALLAWQVSPEMLAFRETREDGTWGDAVRLVLDADLTREQAERVIEARIASR